jgi:prepilin-type N-terminal cleavage/methylation domain-containing protein
MGTSRGQRGFSSIELLLVAAIIAIIAAIAVPHLTSATGHARDVTMVGDLAQLQRAVDLYTAEHADLNPVTDPGGVTTSSGALVVARLTLLTDDAGNVGAAGVFGPYLRVWPRNLYNLKQSLRVDGPAAGANTDGWRIDSTTLLIEADQPLNISGIGQISGSGSAGSPVSVGP